MISAIALFVAIVAASSVFAEAGAPVPAVMDSPLIDSAAMLVRIDRLVAPPLNVVETLTVTVATSGWPVAACAFKIGANSRYIDIVGIVKGDIVDSCKWEYFRATRMNTESKTLFPRSLWSVVALAKFTPDTAKPACFGLNREASIMKLIVTSPPNFPVKDSAASIFFFWEDCRDNTLSDASGQTLLVSKKVCDYIDSSELMSGNIFPTRLGTPAQCIDPRKEHHPRRTIEFHNGGLEFRVVAGARDSTTDTTKTR